MTAAFVIGGTFRFRRQQTRKVRKVRVMLLATVETRVTDTTLSDGSSSLMSSREAPNFGGQALVADCPDRKIEPGSDPRLLRLTVDGLLDRTFGERPHASRLVNVPRFDLPAN